MDGYLMLGWCVDTEDAANFDTEKGLTDEAEAKVAAILGTPWIERIWSDPILHEPCGWEDHLCVGLVLMVSDSPAANTFNDVRGYGMFLAESAEHLTKTAHELYEAVMGRPAETEPEIMCVWTEY